MSYWFRIITVPLMAVWLVLNWYLTLWNAVANISKAGPVILIKLWSTNSLVKGIVTEQIANLFGEINRSFYTYSLVIGQLSSISDYIYDKYVLKKQISSSSKFKLLPLVSPITTASPLNTASAIPASPIVMKSETSTKTSYPINIAHSKPTTFLKTEISPIKKTVEVVPGKDIKLRLIKRKKRTLPDSYLQAIIAEVNGIMEKDITIAPLLVRLAWHCCATYDIHTKTGGSNGSTMRFLPEITDEGNNGLDKARAILEPIKLKFPRISYADLWTFAGKLAIEYMGGPKIVWKQGRIDYKDTKSVPPNGRLPFGDRGPNHIREKFSRMGFNDKELVLLLGGGHSMGECHPQTSGWDGKWTQNPYKFSNEFFKNLLSQQWKLETTKSGTNKLQYYNQDHSLMMLITDFQLLNDSTFYEYVKYYSENERAFFHDFGVVFSKLLELGITRDEKGVPILT